MSTLLWESTKSNWNKELRDRWHLGFLVQSLTAKAFPQHSLVLQPTLSTHQMILVTRPIQHFSPHSLPGNPLEGAHFWNRTSCTWPSVLHIFKLCKLKCCYWLSAKNSLSFEEQNIWHTHSITFIPCTPAWSLQPPHCCCRGVKPTSHKSPEQRPQHLLCSKPTPPNLRDVFNNIIWKQNKISSAEISKSLRLKELHLPFS